MMALWGRGYPIRISRVQCFGIFRFADAVFVIVGRRKEGTKASPSSHRDISLESLAFVGEL
ncbi:hypothetical protein CCP2SC5_100060 [Azospirillaceae bacterium]